VCGADAGALDRAIGNGEEEIREDNENGKGETHRRLQLALLQAGWRRLVAGGGARAGGHLVRLGRRQRASVECWLLGARSGVWGIYDAEVLRGLGRVPKVCTYMSGPRIHLFVIFFSFSDTSRVHIRDVSAPYPCPTHIGHTIRGLENRVR